MINDEANIFLKKAVDKSIYSLSNILWNLDVYQLAHIIFQGVLYHRMS
jgi:hypothetical protein